MEAKELRIGSLMLIDNEKYHPKLKNIPLEVTAITPNLDESGWTYSISLKHINQKPNTYYETYSQFIKWVKPIPLTEEWLLKFNGVHQPWGWVIDGVLIHYNYTMPEGRMFWIELGNGKRIDLPFVHTIQNFFALTGTELTIKE